MEPAVQALEQTLRSRIPDGIADRECAQPELESDSRGHRGQGTEVRIASRASFNPARRRARDVARGADRLEAETGASS